MICFGLSRPKLPIENSDTDGQNRLILIDIFQGRWYTLICIHMNKIKKEGKI